MKIKKGFILREVAGNYIVVSVGEMAKQFNGVINLNQTGAFMWKELEKGGDKDSLTDALLREYDVDREKAQKDAERFIDTLLGAGIVE